MKKILLFLFVMLISVFSSTYVSAMEDYEIDDNELSQNYQFIHYNFDDTPYECVEYMQLEMSYDVNFNINNIQHNESGVLLINYDSIIKGNEIILKMMPFTEKSTITIIFETDKYGSNAVNLFLYMTDHGVFVSTSSFDNAEDKYLHFLYENNYIDKIEYDEKVGKLNNKCVVNNENILSKELKTTNSNMRLNYFQIYGYCKWIDNDREEHVLKNVYVEIFDSDPLGDTKIGDVYTDENGYFSYTVPNATLFENGGVDVFARVYAKTERAVVYKNIFWCTHHYVDSEKYTNVNQNSTAIDCSITVDMTNETGKAFRILQGLIYGIKYAKAMEGEDMPIVRVKYPNDSSADYYDNNEIFFRPDSYLYWDIILHEYGHHLQNYFNITDNPGLSHSINGDLTNIHGKDKGIRLAWGEAWPTTFAIMVTQYYSDEIDNVLYVRDSEYDSYDIVGTEAVFWNYDLEHRSDNLKLGEHSEATIFSLLYDLFDQYNDNYDNVTLGHKNLWDLVTKSNATNFSEFANYCYNSNLINNDDFFELLEGFGFSPSDLNIEVNDINEYFSPTITWYSGSASVQFPNDDFIINFYNENNNLIYTIDKDFTINSSTNKYEYTLTDAEWDILIKVDGLRVSVGGSATKDLVTGYYYSALKDFPSVDIIVMNSGDSLSNYINVNQCYWYQFTAQESGIYKIYTTGNMDTYGELFPEIVGNKSINGRFNNGYNDDGLGVGQNFLLEYELQVNQIIFIRVRGWNWSKTGNYVLHIELKEHVHNYTYLHEEYSNLKHKSYCECGEYILLSHSFTNNVCSQCGIQHSHSYSYIPSGNGRTHTKNCSCGYSIVELCFGLANQDSTSVCIHCNQILNGAGILGASDNDEIIYFIDQKDKSEYINDLE